jgi:serine/threonine protein kinase
LGEQERGSTFLADDPQLGRRVALKIPDFGAGRRTEARLRFLAEARTLAVLEHPHLCPVLESGEVDGRPYLATEYIEGKSLARTMRPGGLPPRQVGGLIGKLALAMQEVHRKGVIHRDLKPANIIFRAAGQRHDPVIVGFGHIHRGIAADVQSGSFDPAGGAPGYLAPEQLRNNPTEIGPACDIFALGRILHELLAGGLPSHGPGPAAGGRGPSLASPSSPARHDQLDPALGAIYRRATATEVGDRYASMEDLAAALAAFLRSPSSAPSPPSSGRPSSR